MEIQLFVKFKSDNTSRDFILPLKPLKEGLVGGDLSLTATAGATFVVLGRSPDSPVPLEGPGISREHLAFHAEDSTVFITDLSANGTWVNGNQLPRNQKFRITDGDTIQLPGYEITFKIRSAQVVSGSSTAPTAPGVASSSSMAAAGSTTEPVAAISTASASKRPAPTTAAAIVAEPPVAAAEASAKPVVSAPLVEGPKPVAEEPEAPRKSFLAPLAALLSSFTRLERFLILVATVSLTLMVLYLLS